MLLVNGQSPGPVLEFDQGNCVVVNVHNKSPYNITVHFHGTSLPNLCNPVKTKHAQASR